MANSLSISMAPQKTSLSVEWPEGIFASPDNAKKVPALKVSGTGNVSFNLHDGLLKSEKTNLSFPGAAIRGNAVLSDLNSTPLLSADLEISATHLRRGCRFPRFCPARDGRSGNICQRKASFPDKNAK